LIEEIREEAVMVEKKPPPIIVNPKIQGNTHEEGWKLPGGAKWFLWMVVASALIGAGVGFNATIEPLFLRAFLTFTFLGSGVSLVIIATLMGLALD